MNGSSSLSVADRASLVRAALMPFPHPAHGQHQVEFARLIDQTGAELMFRYLYRRKLLSAVLASHQWHPAVHDTSGPFWLYQQAGLAVRDLHVAELARLTAAFASADVPLIVYKGVALDLSLGNVAAPSHSNDIDVLVRRDDLAGARAVLTDLGYQIDLRIESGRVRRMPASMSQRTEASVYSFGQCQPHDRMIPVPALEPIADRVLALMPANFCRLDGALHFKMSIDMHYTLNLLSDDLGTRVKPNENAWWLDPPLVKAGDTTFHTLSDGVLSWALLHRLYVDSMVLQERSIKALVHVKLLHAHQRLRIDQIRDAARRYPYLAPSLYYALRAADQCSGLGIDNLTEFADPRTIIAPTMNLGDCLPVLLDIDVEFDLPDADQAGEGTPSLIARLS